MEHTATMEKPAARGAENGERVHRVLFVCTGNTCRSPMAAAVLNDLARPREVCSMSEGSEGRAIVASSAGLFAPDGAPMTPEALTALSEAGIVNRPDNNYAAHRARTVTRAIMEEADEVVAISASHAMELLMRFPEYASRIFTLSEDVPDPYGHGQETYRRCLAALRRLIAARWDFPA